MICKRNLPISNNMSRRSCPAGSLRATASSLAAVPSSSCSFVSLISLSLYPLDVAGLGLAVSGVFNIECQPIAFAKVVWIDAYG